MPINFFKEDVTFKPMQPTNTKLWLKTVAQQYSKKIGALNYIFCSDEYLRQVNIDYLDHDYYTDIITFDNSEDDDIIEGDIFVSIERVEDNAKTENVSFENEWRRVLVHGVLHLIGFDDQTDEQEAEMRERENEALGLFS